MKKQFFSAGIALALLGSSGIGTVVVAAAKPVPTISAGEPVPVKNSPAPVDQQRRTPAVRRLLGGYIKTRGDFRRSGPGWTNNHVKRLAKKARNVKRSKK